MELTHVRLLGSDMSAAYRVSTDALGLPTTAEENPGYAEFEVGTREDRDREIRDPDDNLIELYHDIDWLRE